MHFLSRELKEPPPETRPLLQLQYPKADVCGLFGRDVHIVMDRGG